MAFINLLNKRMRKSGSGFTKKDGYIYLPYPESGEPTEAAQYYNYYMGMPLVDYEMFNNGSVTYNLTGWYGTNGVKKIISNKTTSLGIDGCIANVSMTKQSDGTYMANDMTQVLGYSDSAGVWNAFEIPLDDDFDFENDSGTDTTVAYMYMNGFYIPFRTYGTSTYTSAPIITFGIQNFMSLMNAYSSMTGSVKENFQKGLSLDFQLHVATDDGTCEFTVKPDFDTDLPTSVQMPQDDSNDTLPSLMAGCADAMTDMPLSTGNATTAPSWMSVYGCCIKDFTIIKNTKDSSITDFESFCNALADSTDNVHMYFDYFGFKFVEIES